MSEQFTYNMDDALQQSDDVNIHENKTPEDVAYELLQKYYEVDKLPPLIANHIDYEGVERELEYDGNYFEVDGDVYDYLALATL